MGDASTFHNDRAGQIVRDIVTPTIEAGGSPQDLLVLLESVIVGVVVFVAGSTTGMQSVDEIVDMLAPAVKERAREIAAGLKTEGRA